MTDQQVKSDHPAGQQGDSYLKCARCGRESTTNFASSLRDGWERCCGYTMTLIRTTADIDKSVGACMESQAPADALRMLGRRG